MTNAPNCILSAGCKLADTNECTRLCPSFIAMHGYTGKGGRLGTAGIPADYQNITLKTSPVYKDQAKMYKRLLTAYVPTYARQFDGRKRKRVKSLYLYSRSSGTGKTTTAVALLHEWMIVHYIGSIQRQQRPSDRAGYFLDVNDWQTLYNAYNRSRVPNDIAEPASRDYYRRLQYAKEAPFAVLDDIGVRDCTEGFRGDLHTLINHRATNELPTIYTSNLPLEELSHVFDDRLADRIRDMCIVMAFQGGSKRGIRQEGRTEAGGKT